MTIKLTHLLQAWGSATFDTALKAEIQNMGLDTLPLQQGLSQGSYASNRKVSAMILNTRQDAGFIRAKIGVFYTGIIAGCNCADDPSPINETTEYCEVLLEINVSSADATITLLPS